MKGLKLILFGLALAILGQVNFAVASDGLMDSVWPVFHGDAKLTGQSPYDTSHVDGTIKWKFKAEGGIETSPVIDKDGNIYFVDHKCNLYAVKPDGTLKWKFDAGEPITSKEWGGQACAQGSPTLAADGTVYFLPMTGNLFAVDKNGKEKWKFPIFTFKNAWPTPAIGKDGTIYVGSEIYPPTESGKKAEKPGYFYALNPDGTLKWKHDPGGPTGVGIGTPAIGDDGTIYTSGGFYESSGDSPTLSVLVFNPDGTIKWKFQPPKGYLEGSITLGPDGTLYFTSKGLDDPRLAFFYALNSDGTLKWKSTLEDAASITPALTPDGKLYFGDWGGTFLAYDLNGNKLWQTEAPGSAGKYESLSSSPAIGKEGTIYFGSLADVFYAYTSEGELKWQIKGLGVGADSSPAIGADGTIYTTSVSGELFAIGGSAKETAAVSAGGHKKTDTKVYVFVSLALILLLASSALLILKKSKKVIIILAAASVIPIALALIFYFQGENTDSTTPAVSTQSSSASNSNPSNYACPQNIYQKSGDNFYVTTDAKEQRDIEEAEVDWIRANCNETKWPGDPDQQTTSTSPITNGQSGGNNPADCPRRVYGDAGKYYGIFGMDQRDLTAQEYETFRGKCPDTIWPEDIASGYQGN